ncbi:MAG: RagB/SusD family nutrient uptake outer membrane protein [Pedobacter sp.]|nr:MAG: RagB/SusD family nutrient uptake outer membrane protein [Pedobacter sp.]
MKNFKIQYINILLSASIFCFQSCKKFVTVDTPDDRISTESAYKSNVAAAAVLTGLFAQLSNNYYGSLTLPAISFYEELSADNLTLFDVNGDANLRDYYQNMLAPDYGRSYDQHYWRTTFPLIYTINTAIEGLAGNTALSPAISKRLLGEAYFLRAFCYFYLVNIYGEVPLSITSDYNLNSKTPRSTVADIYSQIELDLQNAESLLEYNYVTSNANTVYPTGVEERIRPNLAAVNALQARVFLYQKNYAAAEAAATKVIGHTELYTLGTLKNIFLKNSSETIWALQPVTEGLNTIEGAIFTIPEGGSSNEHPFLISTSLKNSFEPGDDRKAKWLDSITIDNGGGEVSYVYPAKYKAARQFIPVDPTEYTIVMRLAEQYLIRAEARNEQGNSGGAAEDLNLLRNRSRGAVTAKVLTPLPAISATITEDQLRPVILHERRVELFTEWGHRWFDLKRTGTIDAVITRTWLSPWITCSCTTLPVR